MLYSHRFAVVWLFLSSFLLSYFLFLVNVKAEPTYSYTGIRRPGYEFIEYDGQPSPSFPLDEALATSIPYPSDDSNAGILLLIIGSIVGFSACVCIIIRIGVCFVFCRSDERRGNAYGLTTTYVNYNPESIVLVLQNPGQISSTDPVYHAQVLQEFYGELEKNQLVVVKFGTSWCNPSVQMRPIFEEMQGRYSTEAKFFELDIDLCPAVAEQWDIDSVPTVTCFNCGRKVDEVNGYDPEGVDEMIKKQITTYGITARATPVRAAQWPPVSPSSVAAAPRPPVVAAPLPSSPFLQGNSLPPAYGAV